MLPFPLSLELHSGASVMFAVRKLNCARRDSDAAETCFAGSHVVAVGEKVMARWVSTVRP